ncbi:hypothetical protein EP30_09740 [Bifidobacterium sp. UTCIF-39]|uniref:Cna B-type domain-containing protein n=1 Tax=Bifidobacterium sp. UTCIF-39 TaxID=1465359 RepID=UPI0011280BCC|nr:Cna B-type domain-containing protein [Bifidobacterium sp. UTCIF-39]TPF95998.1 hypothetical protein EP30_09740 [Bifidobacterium sp. UTCIF-39]
MMIHADQGHTHGRAQDRGQDRGAAQARGALAHAPRAAGGVFAAVCSLMLAVAMLLTGFMPVPALADETSGTEARTGSITVDYANAGAPIAGATVNLYHVADWAPNSDRNTFTPISPFSDSGKYPLDWLLLNSGGSVDYQWFATTLVGLIERNKPSAAATATTDANGGARFSGLPKGLYLVLIDAYDDGSITCGPSYVLVALPSKPVDDADATTMDVTLEPKNDCEATPPAETVKRKVVKVWKGDSAANRPGKIVVQLLQDGTVIDEVELNASNNWTHEWNDLPVGHDYQVVEKTVPDGYTVLTDRENDVVTITNTYTPPTTPPSNNTPLLGKTGASVGIAAICAGTLGGLGLILFIRRRHRAK